MAQKITVAVAKKARKEKTRALKRSKNLRETIAARRAERKEARNLMKEGVEQSSSPSLSNDMYGYFKHITSNINDYLNKKSLSYVYVETNNNGTRFWAVMK
jgi:hypothetical protein